MAKAAVLFGLSWLAQSALAKDVHLSWNITWVNAAPNGYSRPVIGINGEWPCPQVDVDLGDRLIVDVYNGLGNQTTGIHWHGFRQYMTGTMDGSSDVTQCPLAPGSRMTYDFMANQTGTYWYHSHNMGQYPDGLRGSLIVHDPLTPIEFDDEFTLTFTDWYNEQMPTLLNIYQSEENGDANGGLEPLPDATLINDASDAKIKVEPNKTYLVHIVCLGNWPGHTWFFEGHDMTVVEVDGVYTVPYPVSDKKLRVTTGQRMSVLIRTKPDISRNYAIWDTADINMMFFYENRDIPEGFNPNATAWLVYDEAKELPPAPPVHNLDPNLDFVDDVEFVPLDKEPLLEPVDKQIILHTGSKEINGISRFTVNGQTYRAPEVPTLYTALTADDPTDESIYGQVNPMVVNYGEVVEIVINNHHANLHPWHLHGHQFQVLQRSAVDGGMFNGYFANISSTPVQRDTIMVQNNGHSVIRFRADNPGIWLLHCHIEWHVESGLVATLIEAPDHINMTIPKDHKQICSSYGAPTSGNADGNTGDTVVVPQLTPGDDGASWDRSQSPGPEKSPSSLQVVNPPAPSPQVASAPAANPQSITAATGPGYIKPDPTSEATLGSISPVTSVPYTPATTNYITPDPTPQPTPVSSISSTSEPIRDSPSPHTANSRPRPTHEWPGAAPFWKPEPHDHKGHWHTKGDPDAPPKPENTLIVPAVEDDDFFSLDFFRKAEE